MNTAVMVIDDDQDVLTLMRVLLEAKGYQVTTYRQPEAALAALDTVKPALIILNWIFWGQEYGPTLLYQLWGRTLVASTPVIVVSGAIYQLQGIREKLEACGVSIVYKPFTLDAFHSTVQAAVAIASA